MTRLAALMGVDMLGKRFRDRREAGRLLAAQLSAYAKRPDVLVLALPRGGVPVAAEVASALGAPLDVFVVRKLGVPGPEESALGAIAPTASPETCAELKTEVDDIICATTPDPFYAVGLWYEDFSQTTDEEVRELLARSPGAGRAA